MQQYDTRIQVRLEENLKRQAEKVFDGLGVDLPTAIRVFLRQSVIQNGWPFGMMGLDALQDTCTNTVTRELLVSDGRAYEVMRTQKTCQLASARTRAFLTSEQAEKQQK